MSQICILFFFSLRKPNYFSSTYPTYGRSTGSTTKPGPFINTPQLKNKASRLEDEHSKVLSNVVAAARALGRLNSHKIDIRPFLELRQKKPPGQTIH